MHGAGGSAEEVAGGRGMGGAGGSTDERSGA